MHTIAPRFRKEAVKAARAYWYSQYGPIPWSAWLDLGRAVAFETADPEVEYWKDVEANAWSHAWDEHGEVVNDCGEFTHASRLTETMSYVRTHFRQ